MDELALIFALGQNGALGRAGGLPWDWPEDRAWFEEATRGHAVIMGRRTFEETGAPLAGRATFIVSKTMPVRPDVTVVPSLDEAIAKARQNDSLPFVIGGAGLFAEALPRATRVLVTTIPLAPPADVFFHFDPSGFALLETRYDARGARYQTFVRPASAASDGALPAV